MKSIHLYGRWVKPLLDRVFALLMLIAVLPFFLLLFILLGVVQKGKVLFFHERVGENEQRFLLIKLSTMRDREEPLGEHDKNRVTPIGKWLRKLSLDEWPQLINVLKGEMSLVGPRPLLVDYLPHYTDEEKKRHTVRPGITGLAQVNGRNKLDWGLRMKYDIHYVEHLSFWLDAKILLLTLVKLFRFKEADFTDQDAKTFIEYASERERSKVKT